MLLLLDETITFVINFNYFPMATNKGEFIGNVTSKYPEIYLAIDDLKDGYYIFHIIQNEKVIKSFEIEKKQL